MKLLILLLALLCINLMACDLNSICLKDRVYSSSVNSTGHAVGVYNDGRIMVDWDLPSYGQSIEPVESLEKYQECIADLCLGMRVIGSANYAGKIVEVFSKGTIKVDWDSAQFGKTFEKAQDLSRSVECNGELCLYDRVINEENQSGLVVEIYADGRVMVNWDRARFGTTLVRMESLGYQQGECI